MTVVGSAHEAAGNAAAKRRGWQDAAHELNAQVAGFGADEAGLVEVELQLLRAVLAENARMRDERAALPKLLDTAWRSGWMDRYLANQAAATRAEGNRDFFEAKFRLNVKQWLADAALQQPAPSEPGRVPAEQGGGTTCAFPSCGHPDHQRKQGGNARSPLDLHDGSEQ